MVQLQRFPNLRHATGVQHHDFVGQRHRFDLIVGDVNHCAAQAFMQTGDFDTHLHTQCSIEVGERFIEQKYAWLGHQRTANRHTLTLTTGERFRFAIQQMRQLQHFRHLVNALVNHLFFCACQFQAK